LYFFYLNRVAGRVLDSFADVLVACLALGLVLLARNTWHSHVDMAHIKETVFKKLIHNGKFVILRYDKILFTECAKP
jgi:hypothetical protein